MGWTPQANRKDVVYGSGIVGAEALFSHNEPETVVVSASGDASDLYNHQGGKFIAGSTAGSEMEVNFIDMGYQPANEFVLDLYWANHGFDAWTDDVEIGLCGSNYNNGQGAVVDLKNEQVRVESDTAAFDPVQRTFSHNFLRIHIVSGEGTTFSTLGRGSHSDEATIPNTPTGKDSGKGPILNMVSNGNDNMVYLVAARAFVMRQP